jgi:hypothetical protein
MSTTHLGSDLVATLACLDVDDFSHVDLVAIDEIAKRLAVKVSLMVELVRLSFL